MRIVVATDAWHPQVNGVVRSLSMTVEHMRRAGHEVEVIEPGGFRNFPCPTYAEIRLALGCGRAVARMLDAFQPDRIHISTEGPIGWAARSWCLKRGRHFTTAFHTRFPDYVSIRTGIMNLMQELADRLHVSINDGRTNEAESPLFEILAKRVRFR